MPTKGDGGQVVASQMILVRLLLSKQFVTTWKLTEKGGHVTNFRPPGRIGCYCYLHPYERGNKYIVQFLSNHSRENSKARIK